MYDLIKKIIAICLFGFGTITNAQNGITASGGSASGGMATVTYSIGQIAYTVNTGSNGSVTQGIQQPFEISVVTTLEAAKGVSLEISVYPNPATDYLKLKIEDYKFENLQYQLFDFSGKLLLNKKTEGVETNITLQGYMPATYFLKIVKGDVEIKIFKIIKH